MKSVLKVLIPLGLLLAVVFTVTYFSRVTPIEPPPEDKGKADFVAGKGLVFFTSAREWDPRPTASLQDQAFPGYFEPGEETHGTQFWFETRNPGRVTLRLINVSCSACSGGRLAPIPPDAARALLQMTAVSALPLGPVAACPPGLAGTGAFLTSRLEWQSKVFKEAAEGGMDKMVYHVPPAPDGSDKWEPGWGILELNFKVKPNPSVPLRAAFVELDEAGLPVGRDAFSIMFDAATGLELDKYAIDAGELADNTPTQSYVVTAFSATRTADELPGLAATVANPTGGPPGRFVSAGPPRSVPEADLARLTAELSGKAGKPVRMRSAFRIPVTVAAKVGDARPDIGRLDREVVVAANGVDPRRVAGKATVTGPVTLAGGARELNLGTFKHQAGASESVVVVVEQPGAALEVVPGSVRPDFLEASLKKLPDAGGRGQWQLTVRVPPTRVQGELTDGLVVLELKGPAQVRVRVPVRGRGVF
jgi:hypothetical protein